MPAAPSSAPVMMAITAMIFTTRLSCTVNGLGGR